MPGLKDLARTVSDKKKKQKKNRPLEVGFVCVCVCVCVLLQTAEQTRIINLHRLGWFSLQSKRISTNLNMSKK